MAPMPERPTVDSVLALTDADLSHVVGPTTLGRGLMYARRGHVLDGDLEQAGRSVDGLVQGSGGRIYSVQVSLLTPRPGARPRLWSGRCSCPMDVDCKHAVALVAWARETFGASEPEAVWADGAVGDLAEDYADNGHRDRPIPPAPKPAWERLVTELTRPVDQHERLPLGLLLDVEPHSGRVRLRPVTPGKNGWVRNKASWHSLSQPWSVASNHLDPAQVEPLNAIAAAAQRLRATTYYSYSALPEQLTLDDLGPRWWWLLDDARAAGIPLLLHPKSAEEATLVADPASVVLDVVRDGPRGDGQLLPVLDVPAEVTELLGDDDADLLAGAAEDAWFGRPAVVGLALRPRGRLALVRVEPPLSPEDQRVLRAGAVGIPAADMPRFLATHAPALQARTPLRSSDGSVEFPVVQPPRLALTVTHLPQHRLAISWSFHYTVRTGAETHTVTVPVTGPSSAVVPRDHAAEARLLAGPAVLDRVVGLRLVIGGRHQLVAETLLHGMPMLAFLDDVLPALREDPDVEVSVQGRTVDYAEADEAPLIRLTVSESASAPGLARTDWFDLGVTVSVGAQQVPLPALLEALTHGVDHVILDSGTWFRLDQPELHDLRRLLEEAALLQDDRTPKGPLRITPYQADLWRELAELGVVDEQSGRWATTVAALTGTDDRPAPPAPAGLTATLRPYQLDGYRWLTFLHRAGLGGILADDMGLGKTMQVLATVLQAKAEDPDAAPVLVVAPTSVLPTWASEAARFAPSLSVATLGETTKRRGMAVGEAIAGAHLVLTSYAVFRLDREAFQSQSWSTLVLDEAQFAKNHQSQVHQCARLLPARVKIAVTGTPMENNLMELWSLLSIVAPGLFPNPTRFREHYARPIEQDTAPGRLETLRSRVRPVMLRRTKERVAADLPAKQEQTIRVELSARHRRIYETHLQRERQKLLGLLGDPDHNRIAIFRSLTLLRQLSLDPGLVDAEYAGVGSAKVDAFLELLAPVVEEGHRALVFSQFTGFLATVRERLHGAGIEHAYLDGRTRNRGAVIDRFRTGTASAFLISLKAGGFGLTLTEADYVFLLDPWWNPAAEAQAVDRTHRIGQDKSVMVYRLVSADTIEEKVVALQEKKRALFAQVVDAGALTSGAITADDIRGLLGPE